MKLLFITKIILVAAVILFGAGHIQKIVPLKQLPQSEVSAQWIPAIRAACRWIGRQLVCPAKLVAGTAVCAGTYMGIDVIREQFQDTDDCAGLATTCVGHATCSSASDDVQAYEAAFCRCMAVNPACAPVAIAMTPSCAGGVAGH